MVSLPPTGKDEKQDDFNSMVRYDELLIHTLCPLPQLYGVTAQTARRQAMSVRQMGPAWPPHITSRGRSNTYAFASTGTTWSLLDNLSTV